MTNPNPAIIPGVDPDDLVPQRDDVQPVSPPRVGDPDSKDGMPNNPDVPIPVPADI